VKIGIGERLDVGSNKIAERSGECVCWEDSTTNRVRAPWMNSLFNRSRSPGERAEVVEGEGDDDDDARFALCDGPNHPFVQP
jgi:uncharacterized Fe-S cluster protein YjdI